MTVIILHSLLY